MKENLLQERIRAFSELGFLLRKSVENQFITSEKNVILSEFLTELPQIMKQSETENSWFIPDFILQSLQNWGSLLTAENLENWLNKYQIKEKENKKIALILAGNIPLVGFHDLICVLLTGNTAVVKQSSSDVFLLPFLVKYLQKITSVFNDKIIFTKDFLSDYQAVIATGSNNTSRYFEYYFRQKPHIIRKNRNSVAILTGDETPKELNLLGKDIFTYFGLGCRSISKLFVPKNYDFNLFFKSIYEFNEIINHTKYANNYDYNKAVYLMSLFKIQDNGFVILKEDVGFSSPIGVIFYEYYDNISDLFCLIDENTDKIQCLVSKEKHSKKVDFGQTQNPSLSDYADGIDTIDFLIKL